MNKSREELEQELTRLHRERIEKELDEIKSTMASYTDSSRKRSYRKRRENIYVLLAIGVIGGFFTVAPRELFQVNQTVYLGGVVFVFASILFLFLKLNSVALANPQKTGVELVSKFDSSIDYLFVFSINGIIILFMSNLALNYFEIELADIGQIGMLLISSLLALLSTLRVFLRQRKRRKEFMKEQFDYMESNELKSKIRDKFFELAETDSSEEEIINSLAEMLDDYKEYANQPDSLHQLKDEIEKIDGISSGVRTSIKEMFENAIQDMNDKMEQEKSIEEIQKEKRKELEEISAE